jgi:excinuclease ABC subunit A
VVEHDEETMRRADHVIDLGPGAGRVGGEVVAEGTLADLMRHKDSITGQWLHHKTKNNSAIDRRVVGKKPDSSKAWTCPVLTIKGAKKNNLKNVKAEFPLNRLVVVTGVSGSGKSTLIRECLLPAVQVYLEQKQNEHKGLARKETVDESGIGKVTVERGHIHAVIEVDQAPIGKTLRSTPATYVGVFDAIRDLYARTPEARMRGYKGSRFSFNSVQGRCSTCEGTGLIKMAMNFMPPAFVMCSGCNGARYGAETLKILWKGRNIAEVLRLSIDEAVEFFANQTAILKPLEALQKAGLGYLQLGQSSPTLSGGEAQRLKLVTHLLTGMNVSSRKPVLKKTTDDGAPHVTTRPRVFLLEEPTIGLHMADVDRLLGVMRQLLEAGHSVIVIEHNMDLIQAADWVIDLGPEGGDAGGEIIARGTPAQVADNPRSITGKYLNLWCKQWGLKLA